MSLALDQELSLRSGVIDINRCMAIELDVRSRRRMIAVLAHFKGGQRKFTDLKPPA